MKKQVLKILVFKKHIISNFKSSKIRGGQGDQEGGPTPDDDDDVTPPPPPTNSCATRGCWSMNRICV